MTTKRKIGFIFVFLVLAGLLMLTGCTRSYESINETKATPTLEGANEFPDALPSDMEGVIEAGAQTATAIALGESAPTAAGEEAAVLTPNSEDTTLPPVAEATNPAANNPTSTVTAPVIATTALPPTAVVGKPGSYTLKKGEFPYCIARRFNIDPKELLALNNLSSTQAQTFQPGLTLSIPQSGAAFPPPRARNAHPTTYTVPQATTVYGVACYFGDVDPAAIISSNKIADPNNIAAGTTLNIP